MFNNHINEKITYWQKGTYHIFAGRQQQKHSDFPKPVGNEANTWRPCKNSVCDLYFFILQLKCGARLEDVTEMHCDYNLQCSNPLHYAGKVHFTEAVTNMKVITNTKQYTIEFLKSLVSIFLNNMRPCNGHAGRRMNGYLWIWKGAYFSIFIVWKGIASAMINPLSTISIFLYTLPFTVSKLKLS